MIKHLSQNRTQDISGATTKGDFTMLRNSLESTDWNHLLDLDVDVDTLVERFNDRLTSLCGVCIPNRVVKISPKDKPGMTSIVKNLF